MYTFPKRSHSRLSAGKLLDIDLKMKDTYTLYGTVVTDGCIIESGAVAVENGTILYAEAREHAPVIGEVEDLTGCVLLPGFIDIHCHAGGEVWCHEDPHAVAEYHLKRGTTGLCCTLYRDLGTDGILAAQEKVKAAMKDSPSILGVHLEGPYLNPRYGAKPSDKPLFADPKEYIPLLETGIVRHATFAPEVEGTDQFLTDLLRLGIVGSIGHSEASPEAVRRAADRGARCVTHLFDATGSSISPTRWDGTIETDFNAAALLCDDLYYEIICDSMGVHVRREMLQLTKKLVGASRIIGITDACGGPGSTGDVNFEDGELNGSKLTMDQVAKNFYAAGFSLSEIAMVTAGNAAKLLGIYGETGSLEQGKRADIVALTKDFTVKRVYKA